MQISRLNLSKLESEQLLEDIERYLDEKEMLYHSSVESLLKEISKIIETHIELINLLFNKLDIEKAFCSY